MSFDYIEKNGIIRQDTETDTYDIALIGNSDMKLAKNLIRAGASDAKFLRQIEVSVDITAPAYWLAELDTYKIATVRNSTSLQHKGMSRDYNLFDFTIDKISLVPKDDNGILCESERDLQTIIDLINKYRQLYKQTKNYTYFRVMRQLIPMGYNYTITFTTNYAVVRNMYQQRHNHRLTEWSVDFCDWVKNLPYANDLLTYNI